MTHLPRSEVSYLGCDRRNRRPLHRPGFYGAPGLREATHWIARVQQRAWVFELLRFFQLLEKIFLQTQEASLQEIPFLSAQIAACFFS